uniref:Uncharacterized protein n=1 Tax=Meloidogyne floridensis TaxID=298350 RepID=A0A915PCB3_9BILA
MPSTESSLEMAQGFARNASTKASVKPTISTELESNGMASLRHLTSQMQVLWILSTDWVQIPTSVAISTASSNPMTSGRTSATMAFVLSNPSAAFTPRRPSTMTTAAIAAFRSARSQIAP